MSRGRGGRSGVSRKRREREEERKRKESALGQQIAPCTCN